jgi:hypothetical protein
LNSELYQLSHTSSPFYSAYFGDGAGSRLFQTICPGWPRTAILLISASQIARITGVSHCPWLCQGFENLIWYLLTRMYHPRISQEPLSIRMVRGTWFPDQSLSPPCSSSFRKVRGHLCLCLPTDYPINEGADDTRLEPNGTA